MKNKNLRYHIRVANERYIIDLFEKLPKQFEGEDIMLTNTVIVNLRQSMVGLQTHKMTEVHLNEEKETNEKIKNDLQSINDKI